MYILQSSVNIARNPLEFLHTGSNLDGFAKVLPSQNITS